jgi:hypothetical protein
MTTTDSYQEYPDFFGSITEARERRSSKQTNPRYTAFNQTHFTAGDEEQFDQYRYPTNMLSLGNQQPTQTSQSIWRRYQDLTTESTTNTFKYMFHKFKKGIFVKIHDGELKVFLPFSKANYYNEWGSQVDTREFMSLAKSVTEGEGYKFNPKRVNQNVDEWYGNNCLMRYEFPLSEGDTNVDNVRNMLSELCKERDIPDVEFFINRRDFPMLKKDRTEPYEEIWGSCKPLVSHSYEKYTPILSMSTSDRFADIAIPNHNDWARIQSKDSKWFPASTSGDFSDSFDEVGWDDKVPIAIFRGASTGKGVTIATNPRLKASFISYKGDGTLLDAGITSWNLRLRKLENSRKLQTIDHKSLPFGLVPYKAFKDQAKNKYILHIAGHVSAFRLSMELATRSVVLKVASQWKVWYEDKLAEYVHFVPVKSDLSDLLTQIEWCKEHDDECRQIALNARDFYEDFLCRKGVLDSLQTLFTDLAVHTPQYPMNNPVDEMILHEMDCLASKKYRNDHDVITCRCTYANTNTIRKTIPSDIADDLGVVFTNKLSIINKWGRMFASSEPYQFVTKTTTDVNKRKEYIHEAYIGQFVTNKLNDKIPNFAHIFGLNKDESVVVEYIPGMTLFEYINSPKFRFDEFKIILAQVALAVKMAHYKYGFVHNDLTPWNIILFQSFGSVTTEYEVGPNEKVSIRGKRIPVIIDFGKSTAVVDGVRHGIIESHRLSSIQDVLTLILTSCKTILATRRSSDEFTETMRLMNFLSGNQYLPRPLKTAFEMKSFLKRHGKFEAMISDDKFELEEKDAIDFVRYLGVSVNY